MMAITKAMCLVLILGFLAQIAMAGEQAAATDRRYGTCRAHLLTVPNYIFYRTSEFGC
jgi:hypothetical protein